MSTIPQTTVVGVFTDRTEAQQAIAELRRIGIPEHEIGVAAREQLTTPSEPWTDDTGSRASEGAMAGIVTGAGVGGLWALGIAAGLLPGIGPVIAGGVLASIAASAAAGAAAGGLVGALIGVGIPEEEARYYEAEFHAGRTIVTVAADERADEVASVLRRFGAYDFTRNGETMETPDSVQAPLNDDAMATPEEMNHI